MILLKYYTICLGLVWLCIGLAKAQPLQQPTFEEVLSLQSISNPAISPDGQQVVYEVRAADWKENVYDKELWLYKGTGTPFPITNNPNHGSHSAKWSPNGEWIAFLTQRGEHTQVYAMRTAGGEAFPVTNTNQNIEAFEWSPNGQQIAFTQSEDKSAAEEQRTALYGKYGVEDEEHTFSQLWVAQFKPNQYAQKLRPSQLKDSTLMAQTKPQLLLDSVQFTINSFVWSPDGTKMAIGHQPNSIITSFFQADISILDIASGKLAKLVANPGFDGLICWSPDGKSVLYETNLSDTTANFYTNGHLYKVEIASKRATALAQNFDERIIGPVWNTQGIFALAWQKTKRVLLYINPKGGAVRIVDSKVDRVEAFVMSPGGKSIAYIGNVDNKLSELHHSAYPIKKPKEITQLNQQIADWAIAQSEVITWKSKDGTLIEGVLHKPMDYDPNKKYPLMVVIHGGPTGISTPAPVPVYVYPTVQWLNKGALVLRPNYRGSAGYGEAFRSLNVRNLGVGDAWDVLSGVQYLEDQGLIDGDQVATMGWSQGGYISAFLTTHSNKFKATSVGAGISNWMTYYVNTDIHPFTRQYLKATPWADKAIYEKTSPMTKIQEAVTPTLIQHGENDRRVPIANAYELYQGLKDQDVPTKLIVYKGFGHGINKPKERLAALWHNWQWFAQYIWGETVEIPMKE